MNTMKRKILGVLCFMAALMVFFGTIAAATGDDFLKAAALIGSVMAVAAIITQLIIMGTKLFFDP